jgi:glycosyltransferase involved in cell wall biosynthesis
MRICFIADSSSLHVQRIAAYHVRNQDEILILSSARHSFFITGTNTVHLLHHDKSSTLTSSDRNLLKDHFLTFLRRHTPTFLKMLIARILLTIHELRLLFRCKICRAMIEQFKPDVVFCNRSFPEGILALFCRHRPLLLRTAGYDISMLTKFPVYRQFIRKTLLASNIIITQSIWERKLLQVLCDGKVESKVINIGVNTEIFHPVIPRGELLDKYRLPKDAFIIVSNRYLNEFYNGWMVIKAVQLILKDCPNLVLLYASPLKMGLATKARVEAISRHFPQIIFVDGPSPHPQLADILGCGDIYISFSSFDGIPNSLLEAMACGLVPIVGELPQLREWIEHGWNGYMVPQKDIKCLAAVIKSTYNNRYMLPIMAERCVKIIQERATYESCMEQMRNLATCLIQSDSKDKG